MRGQQVCLLACVVAATLSGCTKNTVAPPIAGQFQPPTTPAPERVLTPDRVVKKEQGPPRKPSPELCLRAGEIKESLGDESQDKHTRESMYHQATQAYEQAVELDPNYRPARLRLARLYEKTGKPQLTVATLQDCIKQKPDDASTWYELGMCYGRQKQWESSIQCLQKAAGLEPGNVTYANHLGYSLARAGRYDESFEYFRVTVGEAQAHLNLAKMSQHVGRTDVARQHAQAALQLEPRLAEARQLVERLSQDQGVVQASGTAP